MNTKQARYLHRMLDRLAEGKSLYPHEIEDLRKSLPEPPAQKTLEELRREVYDVLVGTNGNEWPDDIHGELETWLVELHEQLRGLVLAPVTVPALPEGMRIAEHEDFGRVIVSPGAGIDRCHEIFYLDPGMMSGTSISAVEPDSLSFIDSEPARPKFLETEADYENAPEGTIVTKDDCLPWTKEDIDDWTRNGGSHSDHGMARSGRRYVLRWGWGE